MEQISVVVPTYQSAAYLAETLSSIQAQTHSQLEILVVDDGSSDDTAALVRKLSLADKRIQFVPLEHQGAPGHCRNAGYQKASSAYVIFFDSDDIMHPTMLEEMYRTMTAKSVDLVIGNVQYRNMETGAPLPSMMEWFFEQEHAQFADLFRINPFPCNKLYRKSFLERTGVTYLCGVFNQDLGFFISNLCYEPTFAVSSKAMMEYMVRIGSITTSAKTRKKHIDILQVFDQIFATWEKTGQQQHVESGILHIFIRSMIFKASFFDLLKETAYIDQIREYLIRRCPNWYQRPEFKEQFTKPKRIYNRLILQYRLYGLVGRYKKWKGTGIS